VKEVTCETKLEIHQTIL